MNGSARAVIAALIIAQFLGVAVAQEDILKVENLGTEINNVVTVEGFVTRYQEDIATTELYHLRDDWGGVVMIRTAKTKPMVGERVRVTGTVTVDPRLNIPSLIEDERTAIPPPGYTTETQQVQDSDGDGVPDEMDRCPQEPGTVSNQGCPTSNNYILYGLIATTLIVLVALIVVLNRMRSQSSEDRKRTGADSGERTPITMPDPVEIIEGETIKIHTPPAGTLKLLPGFFEVVAGEPKIEEIRLYKTTQDPEIETTIGRLPGEPYRHIQLKLQTVSRKQAKLIFANGTYTLINYAPETSNPTRMNGHEMEVNESRVLEEGDQIQMGEVELIYHAQ